MHGLTRTKWDTIWAKHQVNQEESTPKCDTKKGCPSYIKIQINIWLRKNQINIWLIPKHVNTWSVISIGIKSNNTWEIRHQFKNKIPTRRQDTNKRIILDRNQVKKNKVIRYQNSYNKHQLKQISMEEILNSN